MKLSHETRAIAWAALAAALSLGSALLVASPIQRINFEVPSHAAENQMVTNVASSALLALGQRDFALTCADCHGDDAHGDEGPDLHHLPISNSRISSTIHNGIKGEMPSFAKKYDPENVAALVAYIRSLP
jgi:mono/diheme cytochrome c family protein